MIEDQWWNAYGESLKGLISLESFAHPAKVSLALARRIYRHALDEHWIVPGSLCLDPMAGVATFGLVAATFGIHWLGIELEDRFCAMGQGNIALHTKEWLALGKPLPMLIPGDARQLREIITTAGLVVSSPPFQQSYANQPPRADDNQDNGMVAYFRRTGKWADKNPHYGTTTGQLGAMPAGDISAVISSPPYANSVDSQACGIDWTKMGPATGKRQRGPGTKNHQTLTAQLSYQPSCVVSSPPYAAQMIEGGTANRRKGNLLTTWCDQHGRNPDAPSRQQLYQRYGATSGQLGHLTENTYWEAVRDVYAACHDVLPVGGKLILVLKAFVRRGAIVDLPMQTAQLLEHVGFKVLHYHHAMLSNPVGQSRLFDEGEDRTRRASFFRRLAEAKGSPVIDHEVVLCAEKASHTLH